MFILLFWPTIPRCLEHHILLPFLAPVLVLIATLSDSEAMPTLQTECCAKISALWTAWLDDEHTKMQIFEAPRVSHTLVHLSVSLRPLPDIEPMQLTWQSLQ